MKFLKAAVIIMGVLIIAGVAVIVAEIVKRASTHAAASSPVAATNTDHPIETAIPLPPGATVSAMTATSDRVILRVSIAGQPDRLLILDPHSAAVRATVTLGTAP